MITIYLSSCFRFVGIVECHSSLLEWKYKYTELDCQASSNAPIVYTCNKFSNGLNGLPFYDTSKMKIKKNVTVKATFVLSSVSTIYRFVQ